MLAIVHSPLGGSVRFCESRDLFQSDFSQRGIDHSETPKIAIRHKDHSDPSRWKENQTRSKSIITTIVEHRLLTIELGEEPADPDA